MKQLSPEQRELVSSLTKRLRSIRGIKAVVLGGSHARGRAQPESDIDLGIYYSEADSFSVQSVRELAAAVDSVAQLLRETVDLTDSLYQPRYTLPK